MYNFYHNYMKTKYLEDINRCYMNTESFIYDVRTSDISAYSKENIYNFALMN